MKLKYKFEYVNIDDEIICVPVGEKSQEVRGILKINKEGKDIMELLENNTSQSSIVSRLSLKYENDKEEICALVADFLKQLRDYGIIE